MSYAFTGLPSCLRYATRLPNFTHCPKLYAPHRPRRFSLLTSCASSSTSTPTATRSNIHYIPQYPTENDVQTDTIYALATGTTSAAGVAIMRISGPAAPHVLLSLLNPPPTAHGAQDKSQGFSKLPPARTATLRTLYDPITSEILDKALILFFPHPHSFTTEHVVELHLHGSRAVISAVTSALSRVPSPTPRPASRGEFTRRAYEHGAMDLVSAEGLADLIAADTSSQRIQALRALSGDASTIVQAWRERLIRALANLEAVLDFSEDVGDSPLHGLRDDMLSLMEDMKHHLSKGNRAEIVRTGANVALVGPPNAGKSSLLNALARRDAAIVAPTAGTTRDVVDVRMDFAGVAATVSDTAGLRAAPADDVEAEGMRRARRVAAAADVVVCIHDASTHDDDLRDSLHVTLDAVKSDIHAYSDNGDTKHKENQADDEDQRKGTSHNNDGIETTSSPHVLYVFNKIDLCTTTSTSISVVERTARSLSISSDDTFQTSLLNGEGVTELVARIEAVLKSRLETEDAHSAEAAPVITRARHRYHVEEAVSALSAFVDGQASQNFALRMPMDLAAEDLRAACKEVGAITGDIDAEEILDVIFNEFCIGK